MASFEALYGKRCRTPISWNNLEDRVSIELKMLHEMEIQLKNIQKKLKEESNRNKILAEFKRIAIEFQEYDRVLL